MVQWRDSSGEHISTLSTSADGPHRSVPGVCRLVCSGVGRLVGDKRVALRGRWDSPAFAAVSAACGATGRGRAAAGLAGDDFRSGRVGVRRGHMCCTTGCAAVSYRFTAGGDDRVLGLSVGRLRCIAQIPVRLFGRRPFPDAAGRRDRRRVAVRRGLGDAAARCVPRDRCESPRRFLSIACPIAGVVTVTVAVLGLAARSRRQTYRADDRS